jgi:hypothetical protein
VCFLVRPFDSLYAEASLHYYKRIRMPHSPKVAVPLLSALIAVLLLGCGITLSQGHSQTEVFKSLTLTGSFVVGGELQLAFNYAQPYSTSLDVQCEVLTAAKAPPTPKPTADPSGRKITPTPVKIPAPEKTPANRVELVFTTSIGPNPNGSTADEATPVPGSFTHKFNAPKTSGRYKLRCFTPADDNNSISKTFSITANTGARFQN